MSGLVGNPEDRFSHNEAHFLASKNLGLLWCISLFQNLITQFQAQILDYKSQLGVGPAPLANRMTNAGDVQDTVRRMETENVRFC